MDRDAAAELRVAGEDAGYQADRIGGASPYKVADPHDARDLLVVALPGVQSFIRQSRSMSDAAAGEICVAVAAEVAGSPSGEAGVVIILPAAAAVAGPGERGMLDRIVASLPGGTGAGAPGARWTGGGGVADAHGD